MMYTVHLLSDRPLTAKRFLCSAQKHRHLFATGPVSHSPRHFSSIGSIPNRYVITDLFLRPCLDVLIFVINCRNTEDVFGVSSVLRLDEYKVVDEVLGYNVKALIVTFLFK